MPLLKRHMLGSLASGLLLVAGLAIGCTPEPSPGPAQPFGGLPTAAPSPAATASPGGAQQTASVSFRTQVAPLLQNRCSVCHGATMAGGLRLFDPSGAARHSDIRSRLPAIIAAVASGQMPQGGPRFTADEVALLQSWSDQGALDN